MKGGVLSPETSFLLSQMKKAGSRVLTFLSGCDAESLNLRVKKCHVGINRAQSRLAWGIINVAIDKISYIKLTSLLIISK